MPKKVYKVYSERLKPIVIAADGFRFIQYDTQSSARFYKKRFGLCIFPFRKQIAQVDWATYVQEITDGQTKPV